MKVLIINVVCGNGSTGRICTDIAEALELRGHEARIAYGRGDVPERYKKYAVKIGSGTEVKIHALKSRLFDGCGFGSTRATKSFVKWVKQYDPDVIHLHNLHGYYVNIEVLFDYLRDSGKRVIWTMHDCWAFTGHSAGCDAGGCEKWERGCGECPQKHAYPRSIVDRSKRNWKRKRRIFTGIPNMEIITPSQWLLDCAKRSFVKEYPISVINNGIDTNVMKHTEGNAFRSKHGLKDKFMVLGVASSWGKDKGFYDYVSLSKRLDGSIVIVLVGVSNRIRTSKRENLLMLGKTNDAAELAGIYSEADVFLNLTYCDTFPTVNLEARACGLPIITYDTGGSVEASGGALYASVPKGDIDGVSRCIYRLKQDDELKRPRGKKHVDREAIDKGTFVNAYVRKMER